jgi:hypothetical protein
MRRHASTTRRCFALAIGLVLLGGGAHRFSSAELPNFDGTTYASDSYPGVPLRSMYAPVIDRIAVAPFSVPLPKRR